MQQATESNESRGQRWGNPFPSALSPGGRAALPSLAAIISWGFPGKGVRDARAGQSPRVGSRGGHRKRWGQSKLSIRRQPRPTLPLKGTKPKSIVFIKGLYPQAGEDPRGEGWGWGMGWGAGGVARAVGGDGGKVAIAPRLPPTPRRTHSFPWDEHRKG